MAEEIKTYTPGGRIQKPAYNLVAQWVKNAWDAVDPSLIRRSFKCCGISNAQDGSEEHLIFDYNKVTGSNVNNNGNYIYLSDETDDQEVENITTYFNEKNGADDRECGDDYYEEQEINYINNWN